MKKIVASVGLVALGTSTLQMAQAQSLGSPDTSKPWAVSATLRGFYDDNVSTIPNDVVLEPGQNKGSSGYEINPTVNAAWNWERTSLSLGYEYSFKYYMDKPVGFTDHNSQTHNFNTLLNHAFSEVQRVSVRDSFVVGQEPDMLRAGSTFATFNRISGNNIRNYGAIDYDIELTREFGLGVGYNNSYYNYHQEGDGSYSALLDRLENVISLDGKWKVQPQTTGLVGYAYAFTDYTSDYLISPFEDATSDARNLRSHYLYAGVDHTFTPDLTMSLRGGVRYLDYYNMDNTAWSPYGRGSVRYTYAQGSYVEGGFSYDRSATDVGYISGSLTEDATTATVYGTWNHRLTPKLTGSLTGQFQNQTFNGGGANNQDEQIYLIGLLFQYQFNRNFSAQAGYNFDALRSNVTDFDRSYDRNRVFVGVTASY